MPASPDAAVDQIADHYVERHAALDPIAATMEGIGGHDSAMTDYSPDAAEERAEHARATLRALAAANPSTDRIACSMRCSSSQPHAYVSSRSSSVPLNTRAQTA